MLADDNELNREIAEVLLTSTGAVIDSVCNGFQCVENSRDPRRAIIT